MLQGLLHAFELAVQYLAAEQVLDLLEGLAGLGGGPVVLGQRAYGAGGIVRQRVELGLFQPGVVRRIREERGALLLQSLVEQLANLLEGAVEPSALAGFAPPLLDLTPQVIEASPALRAAPEQLLQGLARRRTFQDRLAHLIERRRGVERRRQRVRPTVPRAVAIARDAHP